MAWRLNAAATVAVDFLSEMLRDADRTGCGSHKDGRMALFDPNFDPLTLLAMAVLNPVVIAVAVYMGLLSDQWQKLVVVGFASAFAGAVAIWLATSVGLLPPRQFGSDAGVFLFSFVYGMLVGWIAFSLKRRASR